MWPQRLPVQVRSLTLWKSKMGSRFAEIAGRLFHGRVLTIAVNKDLQFILRVKFNDFGLGPIV
ncbi:hypothetical protein SBDP2_450001 [Syntrophobacter sp. SbD2]|nr:hypothetical protein SBDP2_450001 [Syntrophobacter sp. SbD2]